jgi:hypothetical protein
MHGMENEVIIIIVLYSFLFDNSTFILTLSKTGYTYTQHTDKLYQSFQCYSISNIKL